MKIYIAGQYNSKYVPDDLWLLHNRRLISYFDVMPDKPLPVLCTSKNTILDSGAFSANTSNIYINMGQYFDYMVRSKLQYGIMLDIIGDPDKTYKNLKLSKKLALPFVLIPVLHEGSSIKHLERMVSFNDSYYALSFTNKLNTKQCLRFVSKCYRKFPFFYTKRIHCLGICKPEIFEKYPIYSCDTSTAILSSIKYGHRSSQLAKVNAIIQLEEYFKQYAKLERYLTSLWLSRGYNYD